MPNKLSLGQRVEWTSGASGTMKAKRGEIVAVVPPNEKPRLYETFGDDYRPLQIVD